MSSKKQFKRKFLPAYMALATISSMGPMLLTHQAKQMTPPSPR